jgi:hypothetical protein
VDPVLATSPAEGIAAATAAAAGDSASAGGSAGTGDSASASPGATDSVSASAGEGASTSAATGIVMGTPPNEIYAPNTSTRPEGDDAPAAAVATAPPPVSGSEVISAETQRQSKFLEQLFAGYGTAQTPAPAAKSAQPASAEPAEAPSGIPSHTTRD